MATTVRSHAKINLGLNIGAPRADGFHGLATVYQTLDVHDRVTVTARDAAATRIRLTSDDGRVPTDERNTAWKMTELALGLMNRTAEVEIHIEKRLPVQGGMGAGSGNAVAALVGLGAELGFGDWAGDIPGPQGRGTGGTQRDEVQGTQLELRGVNPGIPGAQRRGTWGTQRDEVQGSQRELRGVNPGIPGPQGRGTGGTQWDEIQGAQTTWAQTTWAGRWMEIAAKVGSDVPLFLIGGTILGVDRGQEVSPLKDIEPVWCVIAMPEIGVSTPQAFRDWDILCAREGLTQEASAAKLNELSRAYASAFSGSFPEGQHAGSSGVLSMGENLAGPQESALVRTGIRSWIQNDFERVVFPQHPSLAEIKRLLAASDTPEAALVALLSGSGSALFGLYQTRGDAEAACGRLDAAGVKSLLTRTLPRDQYWREMLTQEEH